MSLNSKDFDFVMNRFFMASVDFVKDNVPPGWYGLKKTLTNGLQITQKLTAKRRFLRFFHEK